MSGIVHKILPRDDKYFDLFERHAAVLVSAVDELARLLSGGPVDECIDRIRKLETEADDIARDVLTAVRRSFITPFDRSAITALISSLDDAVDEIWHTAKTVRIYHLEQFEPNMRKSADLARNAAQLVREAIPLMRNVGRNGARLHQITEASFISKAGLTASTRKASQRSSRSTALHGRWFFSSVGKSIATSSGCWIGFRMWPMRSRASSSITPERGIYSNGTDACAAPGGGIDCDCPAF